MRSSSVGDHGEGGGHPETTEIAVADNYSAANDDVPMIAGHEKKELDGHGVISPASTIKPNGPVVRNLGGKFAELPGSERVAELPAHDPKLPGYKEKP